MRKLAENPKRFTKLTRQHQNTRDTRDENDLLDGFWGGQRLRTKDGMRSYLEIRRMRTGNRHSIELTWFEESAWRPKRKSWPLEHPT